MVRLFDVVEGVMVPRSEADINEDIRLETSLEERMLALEPTVALHDEEIDQIVSGLEALANG